MKASAILSQERSIRILKSLLSKFYLIFIGITFSCSLFQGDSETSQADKGKLLAEVKENKLYEGDLVGLIPTNASSEDSTALVNRYVVSWIRKQLVLDKAQSSTILDEAEIKRKLLDYKYDLITYEYQSEYIRNNLDTNVTTENIGEYYENNQANFKLRKDVVKGILVKVPRTTANINELKILLASNNKEDFQKLREYCIKFASLYRLKDSIWTAFEDLSKNSPMNQMTGNDVMLNKGKVIEISDNEATYYLKVIDCVLANQLAPIDFVKDRIISMIVNQRKVLLTKALEQQIYEEGKKNNAFKIYE